MNSASRDPRHAADYPVRVINMDRDVERLGRITEAYLEQDLRLDRYPGVSGSGIAGPLRFLIVGEREGVRAGTQGCVLSHIGVWLEIAAGEAPHVLVLEDDALPVGIMPRAFAELGMPEDYDLCYVNERMVPRSMQGGGGDRRFMPLADAMLARGLNQRGNGADGYFVSRKGARRMLDMIYRDRIVGHVDTQLLSYGQTREQLVRLVEATGRYTNMLLIDDRKQHAEVLRSYVMVPPLVRQAKGSSVRKLEDAPRAIPPA